MKQYQPKGGMCRSCKRKFEDCSSFNFKEMRPIQKYGDTIIVKCIHFLKQ